jgi:hypothetical protein
MSPDDEVALATYIAADDQGPLFLEKIYDEAVAGLETSFQSGKIPPDLVSLADDTLLRLRVWGEAIAATPKWGEQLTNHYPEEASGLQILLEDVVQVVQEMSAGSPSE